MPISTSCHSGAALFTFSPGGRLQGNPVFMNLKIGRNRGISEPSTEFHGPGVYAIFFDDHLCYIGSYRGANGGSFNGDVTRARWGKHLGTLTARGEKVSINRQPMLQLITDFSGMPGTGYAVLSDAYNRVDHKVASRDRGMVSTYNRMRFAAHNWHYFEPPQTDCLGRFTFAYVRIEQHELPPEQTAQHLRALVHAAESIAVDHFEPCANAVVSGVIPGSGSAKETVIPFVEKTIRDLLGAIVASNAPIVLDAAKAEQELNAFGRVDDNLLVSPARDLSIPESWPDLPDDDELPAAQFMEQLVGSILVRVPDCEVHFTRTNKRDLRIRRTIKPKRNIMTMYWQTRNQRFCARSVELPIEQGITPLPGSNDPLPFAFSVAPAVHEEDRVLQIHAIISALLRA